MDEVVKVSYPLAETSKPVSQRHLVGIAVVVCDGRNTHVPLMSYCADRVDVVLHSKMHVARAREYPRPAVLLTLLYGALQARHHNILGVVVAASSRAELGESAIVLEQSAALAEGLVLLVTVIPVLVDEHEIGLAGQGQERNFVEDRVEPEPLDEVFHASLVAVAACVLLGGECGDELLRGFQLEGGEKVQVSVVEVGASFLEESDFVGGDSNGAEA